MGFTIARLGLPLETLSRSCWPSDCIWHPTFRRRGRGDFVAREFVSRGFSPRAPQSRCCDGSEQFDGRVKITASTQTPEVWTGAEPFWMEWIRCFQSVGRLTIGSAP